MAKRVPLNEFITANNIDPDLLVFDGELRRFTRKEKSGDECWLVCFESADLQTIVFGDWSSGQKSIWHSKTQRLSVDQHKEIAVRLRKQKELYDAGRKELNEKAKLKAKAIMTREPSSEPNEYCTRKGITATQGAKVLASGDTTALVIPIYNKALEVVNVQTITEADKKFLYGGVVRGCFFLLRSQFDADVKTYVCEGYATAYTLSLALDKLNKNYKIYCVFSAGNISHVVQDVLASESEIIICADNDRFTTNNTGVTTAVVLKQQSPQIKIFIPDFKDLPTGTDANDLVLLAGESELKQQLNTFFGGETTAPELPVLMNFYDGEEPMYHEMAEYFYAQINVIYNPIFWCYFDGKKYVKTDEGWVINKINELCARQNKPFELGQFKNQIQAKCYKPYESFITPLSGFINFNNGVLDVKNFKILPHDKKYNLFYCLDRDYVEAKDCERWLKFLDKIMFADKNSIALIQEIFGYCLLGGRQFMEKVFLFIGTGQNGKGTVTKILAKVVGEYNCSYVPLESLSSQFSAVRIKDKMVNISGEISKGFLQSDVFKKWAAGEEIPMAYKHKDEFDAPANARGIIACNNMPMFDEVTNAIDRRFVMINFKYEIPDEEKVNNRLLDELTAEIEGITCWALAGLKRLLSKDMPEFTVSENSIETMQKFRLTRDNVSRFCSEHLTYTGDANDKKIFNDVYLHYINFCENERSYPVQKEEMSKRLGIYLKNNKFELTRKVMKDSVDKRAKLMLLGVKLDACDLERESKKSYAPSYKTWHS